MDSNGNIYVTGVSYATWGTPVRPHGGTRDAFVAKLNASGALQWHTFLGSSDFNDSYGIAVDGNANAYVVGYSESSWGSPLRAYTAGLDGFIAKLNGGGARVWNAFLGTTGTDFSMAVAVESNGNAYVTGYSDATWGSPIRPYTDLVDAFVVKITSADPPPPVFGGHDFDGNGTSDIAVFRPANGVWYVNGQSDTQWGASGDIPVQGNYDVDPATEIAIFRPASGLWFINGGATTQWGIATDMPVPRDYSRGGITDLAVWRPSNGVWYINGVGDFQWGQEGDYPVPGDYDGDGFEEIAVWRTADGTWYIYGEAAHQFGAQGDIPVPADYDGDGITDRAVYRPSIGMWYIQYSGDNGTAIQWGIPGDIPVPGDYDGNGTADIAIFRPDNGLWYIRGNGTYQFGQAGDMPLVR